jgi:hypothetical protein
LLEQAKEIEAPIAHGTRIDIPENYINEALDGKKI